LAPMTGVNARLSWRWLAYYWLGHSDETRRMATRVALDRAHRNRLEREVAPRAIAEHIRKLWKQCRITKNHDGG